MAESAPITGIYWGTAIFIILGIAGCVGGNFLIGKRARDRNSKFENMGLLILTVTMTTYCMWLQWTCAYLHQLNSITPLIPEMYEAGAE